MVQIWAGWECNVWTRKSTPRPKGSAGLHMEATPRTCLRSCPLLFPPSACWSLPLVLALQSCSPPSHQDAACSRKSWTGLAAWALPLDYRVSDSKSPWASGRDHHESVWVGAAGLEHLLHLGASIHPYQKVTAANRMGFCICCLANSLLPGGNILCFFYTEKEEKRNASK